MKPIINPSIGLGYKIMAVDNNQFVSLATPAIKVSNQIGDIITMSGNGIYLSTDKNFVLDYYSGLADEEVLLTLEFDPQDIILGSLKNCSGELTVSRARILEIEYINFGETQRP